MKRNNDLSDSPIVKAIAYIFTGIILTIIGVGLIKLLEYVLSL